MYNADLYVFKLHITGQIIFKNYFLSHHALLNCGGNVHCFKERSAGESIAGENRLLGHENCAVFFFLYVL